MPYIPDVQRRAVLDPRCAAAQNEGELNFQVSRLLNLFVLEHGLHYEHLGDATSACFQAALEFNRRIVAPYEDWKRHENGDVYDPDIFVTLEGFQPF